MGMLVPSSAASSRGGPPGGHEPPGGGPIDPDAIDKELIDLPAPPAGRRIATLTLMAAAVVGSIALAASLRHDVAYFFQRSSTIDLGEAARLDPATLPSNAFVRIEGTPMASATVRYRRIVTGETYVVAPLAGQRTVFVHMSEHISQSARRELSGRLVTFGELGSRMRSVEEYFAQHMRLPVTSESFVLLVDETPTSSIWALLVVALCALVVVLDVALVLRWFRPLPTNEADTPGAPPGPSGRVHTPPPGPEHTPGAPPPAPPTDPEHHTGGAS